MQANCYRDCLVQCASIALSLAVTHSAWAGATLDGSMGTTGSFSGDFTVPDTVGQTRGGNLFHSFSDFSINAGESATFTGPSSINNVISRVTGSSPSTFNGPLTSAIPGANFYFINPNGLLFKEGAQINVDGSFYATTSDFVRLGQDGIFYADLGYTKQLDQFTTKRLRFSRRQPRTNLAGRVATGEVLFAQPTRWRHTKSGGGRHYAGIRHKPVLIPNLEHRIVVEAIFPHLETESIW